MRAFEIVLKQVISGVKICLFSFVPNLHPREKLVHVINAEQETGLAVANERRKRGCGSFRVPRNSKFP